MTDTPRATITAADRARYEQIVADRVALHPRITSATWPTGAVFLSGGVPVYLGDVTANLPYRVAEALGAPISVKVYCVLEASLPDSTTLHSVWSTEDAAETEAKRFGPDCYVTEMPVRGAPVPRG